MFYRSVKCKTCHVKCGTGDCPQCVELRELLARLEAAVLEQFDRRDEEDAEAERDGWKEHRRCPDCHDDATAYNVSACPTCLGEGYIEV